MTSTGAQTVGAATGTPPTPEHAVIRGQQQVLARIVLVYVVAALALVFASAVSAPFGSPIFGHVAFGSGAPLLTIGATVALGLHVAVFNLTHEQDEATMTPHVISRLDLFSTVGVLVAVVAAIAGWLFLIPVGLPTRTEIHGLDILGSVLSVVVVLVACLAGHIVPPSVVVRVDQARHEYTIKWLQRTADYWAPARTSSAMSHAMLAGLLAVPAMLASMLAGGVSWSALLVGSSWSLVLVVPPALLIGAFVLVLHRKYGSAMLAGVLGLGAAVGSAVLLAAEFSVHWLWFVLVGLALCAWVVVVRSASAVPARGREVIPRVVRTWIWRSLQWRLRQLTTPRVQTGVLGRWVRRLSAWFVAATGRS